jgi:aminoglycoside 3-N-acetyltransferase
LLQAVKKGISVGEKELIDRTPEPRTRRSLAADLRHLGLEAGTVVIAHSSLSSLGWVCGGSVAVVQALMDVVTESGTLVMPTHSADYSDPGKWENPPVPQSWQKTIRENMPAFDPRTVPTQGMGHIPETFRAWPDALRSSHPTVSFAAWGRHASFVTGEHSLNYSLGEGSPLARIYELDGQILLLGAGHESNTSFHLAEYRAPGVQRVEEGSPIIEDGRRVWRTYNDMQLVEEVFGEMGEDFEKAVGVRSSRVGSAEAKLFSQRGAVDFARDWVAQRRGDSQIATTRKS